MTTFVLRVTAGRDGPRGTATHVANGETRVFAGRADLWAFLEEWIALDGIGAVSAELAAGADAPGPDMISRNKADFPPPASGAKS
jgi:hypothetical protein